MNRRSLPGTARLGAGLLVLLAGCGNTTPRAIADSAVARGHPALDSVGGESIVPAVPSPAAAPDTAKRIVARTPATNAAAPRARARRIVFGGVDFTGVGHDRGNPNAPVVVVDVSDFACPYCGEFSRDVYPVIERDYVRTGKVLFKYIPFIAGPFPHAVEATRAAECVAEQGEFWLMADRLYATQPEWKRGSVVAAQMAALAGTTPIDTVKYAACYADRHTDERTARATAIANEIGVRVTPSFLVDGNPVQGALPLAEFRKLIDTALLLETSRPRGGKGGNR